MSSAHREPHHPRKGRTPTAAEHEALDDVCGDLHFIGCGALLCACLLVLVLVLLWVQS